MPNIIKDYCEYEKEGKWQCSLSPSGSHYWLLNSRQEGKCKYCGECRVFNDGDEGRALGINLAADEVLAF